MNTQVTASCATDDQRYGDRDQQLEGGALSIKDAFGGSSVSHVTLGRTIGWQVHQGVESFSTMSRRASTLVQVSQRAWSSLMVSW